MRGTEGLASRGLILLATGVAFVVATAGVAVAQDDAPPTVEEASQAAAQTATGGVVVSRRFVPVRRGAWGGVSRVRRWQINLEGGVSYLDPSPTGTLGEPLPAGATPFDFGRESYGVTGAARLGGIYRPDGRNEIELRGTWYGQWSNASRQTGQFAFDNPPGVSAVATADIRNITRLGGIELNYWRQLLCRGKFRLKAGVGARWLRFDEWAEGLNWVGLAADSFLQGRARSSLYGGQVLVAGEYAVSRRVDVGIDTRVFAGTMDRDIRVRDRSILAPGPHQTRNQTNDFGWGAEVGVYARWRFSERWSVTAAYNFLFLDGVARAAQGLDFSQSATGAVQARQNQSNVYAHVIFLGLQVEL